MPEDVQEKLRNKLDDLENVGEEIAENIQEGIDKNKPTITFVANTSKLTSKLNDWIKGNFGSTSTVANGVLGLKNSKFKDYATGGMPPIGQIFIANEKGPELIGNIGGQSFVANQNQMMDLLDKKIGNAQKNTGTQVINLYLDADHKIGSYTMEQLQNMAKTDGKPITIG